MVAERPRSPRGNRLKQLRAFCHTARLGSITRAAEYLYTSQPAVSQQVRALEEELLVNLFERSGPRISLSAPGRRLYEAAMPVVVGMDRLPDTFAERYRGELSGEFGIAAGRTSATYLVPGLLERFLERYPGTRVNVRTGNGRERLEWLRAYEVDLAFGAVDVPPPDLSFHFTTASRYFLITAEDHPLAGRESVDLAEAAKYPAIVPPSGTSVRQVMDLIIRRHRLAVDPVMEVGCWSLVKRYVAAGVGLSIVPGLCLTDRDRVWRIPFDRYFSDRRYGVFMRRAQVPSLAAERFVQLMEPGLRSRSR